MRTTLKFLCLTLAILMTLLVLGACTPTGKGPVTTVENTAVQNPPTSESEQDSTLDTEPNTANVETSLDTETPTEEETQPSDDPAVKTRPAQEVKVLSMNLDANESTAGSRVRYMAPLLLSFEADSIGVQECRGGWVNLLKKHFLSEGYARVGVDAGGNVDATNGHFATYILYKEDKFNLIDSGTFWLSTTPDVPSIYGPTVDCNRTCTWALLEDKETGFRYVHMNCHLDWMDMSVNKIQVEMIQNQIERFEAMGYPVFAGGDYNCDEGTDSYFKMLESEVVADAKKVAEKANDIATYPDYGKYDVYDPKERPIDYFFVTKDHMTVKEYRVVDEKPEDNYISDHFPVFVHALVHEMPLRDEAEVLPGFSEEASVTATVVGTGVEVAFGQATDKLGVPASGYRVEFIKDGEAVLEQTKSSGVLTLDPPETISFKANGLNESGTYTVKITPYNIFGDEGTPITADFEFSYDVTSSEMPAADIVDIRVNENGFYDASPNAMAVENKGVIKAVETDHGWAVDFNKRTNAKISGIKDHYKSLETGFTMEAYFTMGEDVTTYQCLASNMHAGGFGFDIDKGSFRFVVRIGSAYLKAAAAIEANTTYHAVGVYDGSYLRLYLNGALVSEVEAKGAIGHPTDNGAKYLCIGADSDATGGGEYPIDATVYLVRMYTAVANDSQALYLYEQVSK